MPSTRITDVPWDLVTDVLSRLPVKSLLRFSSVAKSFHALSKDPQFISRHLHRSSNNGSQLLIHTNSSIDSGHFFSLLSLKTLDFTVDPHFPSPESDTVVVVVGSCNGIVCLLCHQGPYVTLWNYIILWNPSIREHMILPPPILPYSLKTNFNSIGSGFHNGEYKVVRIASYGDYKGDLAKIEIYSTASNLWREINTNLPHKFYHNCSVIIRGTPYWIGYESDNFQRCIVSFDMASEVFHTINLPSPVPRPASARWNNDCSRRTCGIGTINDHLAVYFYDDRSIEIWAMYQQNSDEKWTKLFAIRNFPAPGWPLGLYGDGLFIWIKSEESRFPYSPSRVDLLAYSPLTTKEVKSIECLKDLENVKTYAHLESFVRINSGNEHS